METVFTFDVSKIYPEVIDGLQNGKITLRDGVAYWTELAEKTGIAQHMPLKPVDVDLEKLSELGILHIHPK